MSRFPKKIVVIRVNEGTRDEYLSAAETAKDLTGLGDGDIVAEYELVRRWVARLPVQLEPLTS